MVTRLSLIILALVALHRTAAACEDPVAYGAIPDDGISDRVAIQAAIDADPYGTVCLGLGRWSVERAPVGSYNRFAAISTHSGTTIVGEGPGTVIELVGDQGGGGVSVISIDPGAFGATVRDLTIDTSASTNTDEQTHAISIGSSVCQSPLLGGCMPVLNTRVERVRFVHPAAVAPQRKGDCVRLLGNGVTSQVRRVSLSHGIYSQCARSAVSIQRNVYELSVVGNLFQNATDQDIDSEPTGGSSDLNSDIVISGNVFADDRATSQGDHAVTIGGIGGPMRRVVVSDNVFYGRGIRMYRSADVVISGNVITAEMTSGSGVIEAGNVADGVIIANNHVRRTGVAGPLIRTWPQSGAFPGPVLVSGNRLVQGTVADAVYLESTDGAMVVGNRVEYAVSAPLQTAISFRATARDTAGIQVRGNTITAPSLGYAVRLTASPYSISDIQVTDNTSTTATGIVCSGSAGGTVGSILSADNHIGARSCSATFIAGD